MLGLLFAFAASSATAEEPVVAKGDVDLLHDATLSQPFTIFDQLLLRLEQKAQALEKDVQPKKNEFRWSRVMGGGATSRVQYDKSWKRTAIEYEIYASGVDDPWRDVCSIHVRDIATRLFIPTKKYWDTLAPGFFSDLLGPRFKSGDEKIAAYKAFSESIVVVLGFLVGDENQGKLKVVGYCYWDNKTGDISFRESKR